MFEYFCYISNSCNNYVFCLIVPRWWCWVCKNNLFILAPLLASSDLFKPSCPLREFGRSLHLYLYPTAFVLLQMSACQNNNTTTFHFQTTCIGFISQQYLGTYYTSCIVYDVPPKKFETWEGKYFKAQKVGLSSCSILENLFAHCPCLESLWILCKFWPFFFSLEGHARNAP